MLQIHLKGNKSCKKNKKVKDIQKMIRVYFNKNKHACKIICCFDKKTLKKLFSYLDQKYKHEVGGIFKIENTNHDILGNIYNVKLTKFLKGQKEDVDIIDSPYNFHTHPKTAYLNHNCELGWPSLDDFKTYLYSFLLYNTFFHAISTLEGIYILSINPECFSKLKSKDDIPLHLEKWIDNNLFLSKENLKISEGKYVHGFGNINSGEQFVKYINTKKYGKWKCNIFLMVFLPWKILNENVYTCFSVYFPKIKEKCNIQKNNT